MIKLLFQTVFLFFAFTVSAQEPADVTPQSEPEQLLSYSSLNERGYNSYSVTKQRPGQAAKKIFEKTYNHLGLVYLEVSTEGYQVDTTVFQYYENGFLGLKASKTESRIPASLSEEEQELLRNPNDGLTMTEARYQMTEDGKVSVFQLDNEFVLSFYYDEEGKLDKTIREERYGMDTTYYDALSRPTKKISVLPGISEEVKRYSYNGAGDLEKVSGEDSEVVYFYENDRLSKEQYMQNGQILEEIEYQTNEMDAVVGVKRYFQGRLMDWVSYSYGSDGLLVQEKHLNPDSGEEVYSLNYSYFKL